MNTVKKYTLYVSGTHCASCKHLIEETLAEEENITEPSVSLTEETVTFSTTSDSIPEELAAQLTSALDQYGYKVFTEQPKKQSAGSDWLYASIFAVLSIIGFITLGQSGFTSLIKTGNATLATALIVGLVASVSTCLAVVGGLVLSVSATYAQEGKGWMPQILFHAGRLGGFFILGGFLGMLGEAMQIGFYGSTILGVVVSIVMIVLGVHLLGVTKKVRVFTLPKGISESFIALAKRAGVLTPVALGAVTFFLPCGFTQSMQIVSLSSGSFITGALTMTAFALGTLPVLGLLSFGSLDLAKSRFRGVFFKTVGLLVILFAVFNLHNALVFFNVISPIISF